MGQYGQGGISEYNICILHDFVWEILYVAVQDVMTVRI